MKMTVSRIRVLGSLAFAVLALSLMPGPVHAAPPPPPPPPPPGSLQGENFVAGCLQVGQSDSVECHSNTWANVSDCRFLPGDYAVVYFSAHGLANGAYTGTFDEVGVIRLGPNGSAAGG